MQNIRASARPRYRPKHASSILRGLPAKRLISFIPFFLLLILFFGLRIYRLHDRTLFQGDQGLDMMVLWSISHTGIRPLVGPILSLDGVLVPPTFYYLLWVFYSVTHSYVSVLWGIFALSFVSWVILMWIIYRWLGRGPALIAGLLIAVCDIYVFRATNIWDPNVTGIFHTLAIGLLIFAFRNRNRIYLWAGIICFAVAISIYPSAFVLLPLLIYAVFVWFRQKAGQSAVRALMSTGITIGVCFILIFSPLIVAESKRQWQSVRILTSQLPVIRTAWHESLNLLITNLLTFVRALFPLPQIIPSVIRSLLFVIAGVCFLIIGIPVIGAVPRRFRLPVITALLIGYVSILAYRGEPDSHRLWGYLPIFIIFVSYGLYLGFRLGGFRRIASILFLSFFLTVNVSAVHFTMTHPENQISTTQGVAGMIAADVHTRNLTPDDIDAVYRSYPTGNDNYELPSIFYWLGSRYGFPITLNRRGNLFRSPGLTDGNCNMLYVICDSYPADAVMNQCAGPYITSGLYRAVTSLRVNYFTVIILEPTQKSSPPAAT